MNLTNEIQPSVSAPQQHQAANGHSPPPSPCTDAVVAARAVDAENPMYRRVGQMTRALHDALRELGHDRNLAAAAQSLPDARDRLTYIVTLTSEAANRVLSAVETGQANQDALEADTRALNALWGRFNAGGKDSPELFAVAAETRAFLARVPERTAAARAELHTIMMAQDFQDLTGQVIKRVAEVAHKLESSLLALLLETRPANEVVSDGELSGPVIHASAHTIANQAEADALLESLGF